MRFPNRTEHCEKITELFYLTSLTAPSRSRKPLSCTYAIGSGAVTNRTYRPWRNDAVTNRNLPALEERCGYKPQPTGPGGTMRLQTAPTGLGTAKLTLMVRFGNRAYRGWRFAKLPPLGFTMFNPYVSNANSCYTMFLIQLYNLHRSARRCL